MTFLTVAKCRSIIAQGAIHSKSILIDIASEVPTSLLDQVGVILCQHQRPLKVIFWGRSHPVGSLGSWLDFLITLWTSDRPINLSFQNITLAPHDVDRLNQTGTVTHVSFVNCNLSQPLRLPSTMEDLSIGGISIRNFLITTPVLQSLSIGAKEVTGPDDWAHLLTWDLPILQKIQMNCVHWTPDQADSISAFFNSKSTLQKLLLSHIPSDVAPLIFYNLYHPNLHQLFIHGCDALEPLVEWIPRHPHLREINLIACGEVGSNFNSLVQSLTTVDSVTTLTLDRSGSAQFQTYLATTLSLQSLTLTRFHCPTQDVWDSLMAGLELNKTLHTVTLSSPQIDPSVKMGPALGRMVAINRYLRVLEIGDAQMDDAGLVALMEGLISNSTLHTIGLEMNNFGPQGLEHLYRTMGSHPSIQVWHLGGDRGIGSTLMALAAAIVQNPRISSVTLEEIDEPSGQMDAFLMQLAGHPGLTTLSVLGTNWRESSIDGVIQFIQTTPHIQSLYLGADTFETDQIGTIYQTMNANSSITSSDLTPRWKTFKSLLRRNQQRLMSSTLDPN